MNHHVTSSRMPYASDERIEGSPPAPPFIMNLGAGLLALGIVLAVLVLIDRPKGSGTSKADLVLAGTFAVGGVLCLLVGWLVMRREARIWRSGYRAEATVTSVHEAAVQISKRYFEEPRWVIEYSYRDASGNLRTGNSGYVPLHIAATWRAGDKGQ